MPAIKDLDAIGLMLVEMENGIIEFSHDNKEGPKDKQKSSDKESPKDKQKSSDKESPKDKQKSSKKESAGAKENSGEKSSKGPGKKGSGEK